LNKSVLQEGFARYQPAACLRVTGSDALAFLQGQFTQELRPGPGAPVAYGLWLNQKGKVLADSFVLRIGAGELWLFSYASPAAVIRERLEAYIIADDVAVEDLTAGWSGLVAIGPAAAAWLEAQAGSLPPAQGFLPARDGFVFRGRRGAPESWEWLTPAEMAPPAGGPELTRADLERLRIAAAIPAVPADLGPTDLPNEGGLDADAVSYTKGCYLGQEVMARIKSMGQVRRRLLRVAARAAAPPACPAPLFQGTKKVGELRSAVDDGAGGTLGLALLTLLGLDAGAPLSLSPDAPGLFTVLDPP